MQLVWFKRDLRAVDHAALQGAIARAQETNKTVLALYILEPDLWQQPDMSGRQYAFLQDCLRDLYRDLKTRGITLSVKVGAAVKILSEIHKKHHITELWSHQETV